MSVYIVIEIQCFAGVEHTTAHECISGALRDLQQITGFNGSVVGSRDDDDNHLVVGLSWGSEQAARSCITGDTALYQTMIARMKLLGEIQNHLHLIK